ncbi:MAG: ATP-dependent protease ATPase subunit HslU [Phycisphaerae bacterium]
MVVMSELTPRQIVQALDRYIVGQDAAKRAVAVAIRNRWRRLQLGSDLREDVSPHNIMMIGPTGVGKTEIARRIAQLINAPFVKVEATKFTEVGYAGRDVDSIIRDLMQRSISIERQTAAESVREKARLSAEDRLLDQLLPGGGFDDDSEAVDRRQRAKEKLRDQLRTGMLADRMIEVTSEDHAGSSHMMSVMGVGQMGPEFERMFEKLMPPRSRKTRLPVPEALEVLLQQEIDQLIDHEAIQAAAVRRCEQTGIVFLDEIDKICAASNEFSGPDVSRSGVQRDLLPLVEGTAVSTRYGLVHTDHILFIAAGAFAQTHPADLMPELQGRFPLRVELEQLSAEDYHRILTEPHNALIKQQIALMATEGVKLTFTDGAMSEMAEMAHKVNETLENIGARRLYTIVEKVMEDIAFHASDAANKDVVVDVDYVRIRLADVISDKERRRYEL